MATMTARQLIDDWHRLLAARDPDGLTALLADEVEIAGPRGSGQGSRTDIREWVDRSGIRLEPRRVYQRGDAVVVEQAARWPVTGPDANGLPAADEALTDEQTVFTAFQVRDGRITRLLRFDALAPALTISGLTRADVSS